MAKYFCLVENVLADNSFENPLPQVAPCRGHEPVLSFSFVRQSSRKQPCELFSAYVAMFHLANAVVQANCKLMAGYFSLVERVLANNSVAETAGMVVASSATAEPTFFSVPKSSRNHSSSAGEDSSEQVRLTDAILPLKTTV